MAEPKNILKCAIIVPPEVGRVFPRGAVEVATFLKTKGVSISLLHMGLLPFVSDEGKSVLPDERRELERAVRTFLEREQPDVVGVSCVFTISYPSCLHILRTTKQVSPRSITVIGGTHPTFTAEVTVLEDSVGAVVRGEGEWTMLDLLDAVRDGRSLREVSGLTIKHEGKPFNTGDRAEGYLPDLPLPDYSLFSPEELQSMEIYGIASRGCKYRCRYCVEGRFWGSRRHYADNRIVDEIERLKKEYDGKDLLGIEDSMVHLASRELAGFCAEVKRRALSLPDTFCVASRVDTVTEQGVALLRESGIKNVRLGIESGSEKVRKQMSKTFSNEDVLDACTLLRDNGIDVLAFWMIGLPGDNPHESQRSLRFMEKLFEEGLIKQVALAMFIPYPGTEFYANPAKYGIEILTMDWSKWERWTPQPIYELSDFPRSEISRAYLEAVEIIKRYEKKPDEATQRKHEFAARIRGGSLRVNGKVDER